MRIHTVEPEWNGKKFCDNGKGFDPAPINAPSVDYSGPNIQDASYNFMWEQKMNNEEWTVVNSAEGKSFIPSYNPPLLRPGSPDGKPVTYSWRLKIRDVANGLSAISEIYGFTLAQTPKPSHVSSQNNNQYSIDLSVLGGYPGKKFSWIGTSDRNSLSDSQSISEDLKNVSPGNYTVTIRDTICESIKHNVVIGANPTK